MFVLGIDPGLSRCGYGCVIGPIGSERAVAAGVITTDVVLPVPQRLALLRSELVALIEEFHPDVVVVERVLFQTNARTAMSVGQASGVALLTASEANIEVVEYSSNEVKLAVAGYGAATKVQVQTMVARLLKLARVPIHPTSPTRSLRALSSRSGPDDVHGGGPMIGSLRGTIAAIEQLHDGGAEVMIDVSGVGYDVTVGARCAATLPSVGEPVALSIYTHMREGAITLFGFPDRAERQIFSLVITAHGIGPALGLAILGTSSPSTLTRAVATGDVDALTLVPGVGKKTAQRLIIDLTERLGSIHVSSPRRNRAARRRRRK